MSEPAPPPPEFARLRDIRQGDCAALNLVADPAECAALARRFALVRVDRLEAKLTITGDGAAIEVRGTLRADIVQSCAISADDLPVSVREDLHFRFVPARDHAPGEEIELDSNALDEIEFSGGQFDLGEAVAQSLALAIDPFLTGPGAEEARRRAGLLGQADTGPFAALKGLLGNS